MKDTRRKMFNPQTGRMVFMTGSVGRALREAKKRRGATKRVVVCSGGKCRFKEQKKKATCLKRDYGFAGATARPSASFKKAGKTKGCVTRPSARANFDAGNYDPVFYAGKVHVMRFDSLGRPRYQAV